MKLLLNKLELIHNLCCSGLFLLGMILQAKDVMPQWNAIMAQIQVLLSVCLTVRSPEAGYKAAVLLNFVASCLAAWAAYIGGDIKVFPGIIIPLCTIITASVISTFHRRLIKELAESVQRKKELHYRAFFDPLTDLQNRGKFQERLTQAVLEAKLGNHGVALMMIDLDWFKSVNDAAGHAVGDLVLQEVGKRLVSCVREKDLVYRVGGDEFTVLLEKFSAQHDVRYIADRILATMSETFVIESDEFIVGASIGISLFPADGEDARTLMKKADDAMYDVKRNGGNSWGFLGQRSLEGETS